ncbi:hypothetical protein SDJN02_03534, partial [Cucurbita argyrosperma subsp. argyrosperma]
MSDPEALFISDLPNSVNRTSKIMAPFLFLLFIFANALLGSVAVGAAPPPTAAEPPSGRKLGKHHSTAVVFSSPSEAPRSEKKVSTANDGGTGNEIELENHEHHKSIDKSVAGGGVILGGLATTFLVAIVCYIRATRRQSEVSL